MNEKITKVIENLKKNNMDALFAQNKAEVCEIVKGMLFDGAEIASGGSMSLKESGVWEIINLPEYKFYDRTKQGLAAEEVEEIYRKTIGCDFYFCSSNAVTENGELINVDGFANRVSAIAFGPKKVIMVVGANKIVKDVEAGILRVKTDAAPKNAVRLHTGTPCEKLGHCIALLNNPCPAITDGCANERRICADYLISARQKIKDRITVIICEEELGY